MDFVIIYLTFYAIQDIRAVNLQSSEEWTMQEPHYKDNWTHTAGITVGSEK
jgi:hypothetical protein